MFKKKKSKLKIAQEETQNAMNETNKKIEELGGITKILYDELTEIQYSFDYIRNIPSAKKVEYNELKKIRIDWKDQTEKIEKEYNNAVVKKTGAGVTTMSFGVTIVTMGPTLAMGFATTFGVASTGTAISTLSGAAATNAALAWLGGGAIAAGGGGMLAGEALLALAGPVGWTIVGISLLASGLLIWKNKTNYKYIESIFISIKHRDTRSFNLAIVELNERIKRINDEIPKLKEAIKNIIAMGKDYNSMTEKQQYELGTYVNLMSSSTQLLVNPILGIQPKYTINDYNTFKSYYYKNVDDYKCNQYENLIISLANFLYKINLNDRDKKLLWWSLRKNKDMLNSLNISESDFDISVFNIVFDALEYKYSNYNT